MRFLGAVFFIGECADELQPPHGYWRIERRMTTFLGVLGAVISFILWLPQAKLTWVNRRNAEAMAGLSIGTQSLVVLNSVVWGLYAYCLHEFWVGAAGLVNGPLSIMIIVLILRGRKIQKTTLAE